MNGADVRGSDSEVSVVVEGNSGETSEVEGASRSTWRYGQSESKYYVVGACG